MRARNPARRLSARIGTALCAWTALVAGCGSGEAVPVDVAAAEAASARFLHGDPRLAVAHVGIRRLEFPRSSGAGRSFRERIATDGRGRFSIEPLDALAASGAEWDAFALMQRLREGFLFRYRDFVVRDPDLLARNWRVSGQGPTVVAGRACTRQRLERTEGEARTFELSIDVQAGLVLASRELDAAGELVAAMTYESVRLDPDLSAVVWHVPANDEHELAREPAEIAAELGAEPVRPRLLPRGYGALGAATVEDGQGTRWLELIYSDGVEPLFFLQAVARGAETGAAEAPARSARLGGAPRPSSVVVFTVGAATVIQGEVDGFDLMVIGKAPETELLDLLESSLP